jgi:hypothetical protein
VQPTDEELFQKYNPELQKRSLERRFERQQEFDDFVTRLKRDAKSDKPSKCWISVKIPLVSVLTRTQYGLSKLREKRSA